MRVFCSLFAFVLVGSSFVSSQESAGLKLTHDEQEILNLTNAARKEHKLPPLIVNATLMKAARLHSENMASQKKMAHELDGKTPAQRVKALGYAYRNTGENVAYGERRTSVHEIFEMWMKSEGHRKNILNSAFTEIGIGMGAVEKQKYYTQVFGRR